MLIKIGAVTRSYLNLSTTNSAFLDNDDSIRIKKLSICNQDSFIYPLIRIVIEIAEHRKLHIGVNSIVVKIAVNSDYIPFSSSIKWSNQIILNQIYIFTSKAFWCSSCNTVVHATDWLSLIINHPIDIRFKRTTGRSEEHTSELQSRENLVCRLLLEKKKKKTSVKTHYAARAAMTL